MNGCAVDGCERLHYGLGWCRLHWRRFKSTGDPLLRRPGGPAPTHVHCTIAGCDAPHEAHGLCKKHVTRRRRRGDPEAPPLRDMTLRDTSRGRPPVERFVWHLTAPRGLFGCWEWNGSQTEKGGYGRFAALVPITGEKLTHRSAYILAVGPIPDGLQLDHLCRNPPCCNPWHLEPVTGSENMRRGVGFGARNYRKTHCNNGHELAGANIRIETYGSRRCKICAAEANRRYLAKKRAGG